MAAHMVCHQTHLVDAPVCDGWPCDSIFSIRLCMLFGHCPPAAAQVVSKRQWAGKAWQNAEHVLVKSDVTADRITYGSSWMHATGLDCAQAKGKVAQAPGPHMLQARLHIDAARHYLHCNVCTTWEQRVRPAASAVPVYLQGSRDHCPFLQALILQYESPVCQLHPTTVNQGQSVCVAWNTSTTHGSLAPEGFDPECPAELPL
jgi:hypothetical protein